MIKQDLRVPPYANNTHQRLLHALLIDSLYIIPCNLLFFLNQTYFLTQIITFILTLMVYLVHPINQQNIHTFYIHNKCSKLRHKPVDQGNFCVI